MTQILGVQPFSQEKPQKTDDFPGAIWRKRSGAFGAQRRNQEAGVGDRLRHVAATDRPGERRRQAE
jgi:hypothetical protein